MPTSSHGEVEKDLYIPKVVGLGAARNVSEIVSFLPFLNPLSAVCVLWINFRIHRTLII